MHVIGEDKNANDCFEESFRLIFKESGEKIDGVERLYTYCEENNVEPDKVLERILTTLLDSDGEMNIKFKEKIKADEVED